MPIQIPSIERLQQIAESFYLDLSPERLESFRTIIAGALGSYERVDQLVEPTLPVKYPRSPGYRPGPEENKYNAWYYKTSVRGSDKGKLLGKKVVLKDNICLAGVPMMNGSKVLEGFVPSIDATIVTRILDAGGEIVGKAVSEDLCFSGSCFTCATGAVLNPHNTAHSSGGSSSGSAALVAADEVDMAIGGDQGGSIRIPSCWCGVYGLKPTYGLVPYTGIFPIELTIDHTGPITKNVEDAALLLEVIAGVDGLDPRQTGLAVKPYKKLLATGESKLKVGIVKEGFGWEGLSEEDVDEMVREAAYSFTKAGAMVEEVSIPFHRDGVHIWNPIATDGATALMITGNSMGTNWKGFYTTQLLDTYGQSRVARANDFSETVKLVVLLGQYMLDNYQGKYYAKAQNLSRSLKQAYDDALNKYDVLVMPTLPLKATPIPATDCSLGEYVSRALEMIPNTAPFNVTGHPAMNVPCGMSSGLPVGMMIIGKFGEDETVLRAAHVFEKIKG